MHPLQGLVKGPLKGAATWPRSSEANLVLQFSTDYL
jgi:hypothetical protein